MNLIAEPCHIQQYNNNAAMNKKSTRPLAIRQKRNFRFLPLWFALALTAEIVWSERVWMMVVVALGGLWLFEWVWARMLRRGLGFRRELRYGWAQVGDQLEERFTLTNSAHVPALWVQVTDHSNLADYESSVATGVASGSENAWTHKYICAHRGAFHLGPTTVSTGTPFGIYSIEFEYAASDSLIVMPPIVPLPEIPVAPGGSAYEGRRRASTFEQTVSAAGVREYAPGDPFKMIHWRTVAHANEWMVRVFENTPAGNWWIWLDLDANAQAGAGENSTLEHSIIMAASLTERGLRAGRAVGLLANARAFVHLEPQRGEYQRLRILRALATIEPGPQPLGAHIETLAQTVERNASVIIITPALEGEWLRQVLAFPARATAPTVILLDRASYGGAGDVKALANVLAREGIAHFVVTRDLMDRPEARPGQQGAWEWRVSATGRAIPRHAPSDQTWRTLA